MTIYIDIILFENIILTLIILIATALIGNIIIKKERIVIASIIGSIISTIEYIQRVVGACTSSFLTRLLLSTIIILIAFKQNGVKAFIKDICIFYLTSFTFGGIALLLIFSPKSRSIIFQEGHFIGVNSTKNSLLAGTLGLLLCVIISRLIKRKTVHSMEIRELEIFYKGKAVKVRVLVDSRKFFKRSYKWRKCSNNREKSS
jgi:stage II sporulation protein GA (sporulation sigma-E factor processing peptidase)